ncbi:unnamed protein product [marine sediment metagenome]|uniref:Uncharacterized protein n=1 Tax=marine sediment metagenome TaxID=412755 RepID=X1P8F0_9ZZZZ
MTRDANNIILGTGRLWINDTEVGYLKGDVEFSYVREKLDFKPSGVLAPVMQFVIGETAELKASEAEFKLTSLQLAMGVTTTIDSFSGSPSYNPASFSAAVLKTFDYLTFGGSTTVDETLAIRFEHIRPNSTKKIIIILYTAVSLSDLALAFHDEDFNLIDVAFRGLADASRPAGDQIGMVIEQMIA